MSNTYSPFYPCMIVMQRDPSVIGRTRKIPKIHDWNDSLEHIDEREVLAEPEGPIPLRTILLIDKEDRDFYSSSEPIFCDECFGGIPEVKL